MFLSENNVVCFSFASVYNKWYQHIARGPAFFCFFPPMLTGPEPYLMTHKPPK